MKIRDQILESADLAAYKKLINVLGAYTDKFPGSAVDTMFNKSVSSGKKIMPKDKHALSILKHILNSATAPSVVQQLLNSRFSDLPVSVRPKYKDSRRVAVAFWNIGGVISDKISSLIALDGGTAGFWSDAEGEKVSLVDTRKAKESVDVEEPALPDMKMKKLKDADLVTKDVPLKKRPDSVQATKCADTKDGIEKLGDIDDVKESRMNESDDELYSCEVRVSIGGKKYADQYLDSLQKATVKYRIYKEDRSWGIKSLDIYAIEDLTLEVFNDDGEVIDTLTIAGDSIEITWVSGGSMRPTELDVYVDVDGTVQADLTMQYIDPSN